MSRHHWAWTTLSVWSTDLVSPFTSVSCSLNSVMFCYPVPRPWFCSVYYMYKYRYFSPPRVPSPTPLVCSHYTRMENLALVWLPSCQFLFLDYPTWFILHMFWKRLCILFYGNNCFTDFEYVLEYTLCFLKCFVYSPTCQTVVSDLLFGTQVQIPLPLRRSRRRRSVHRNS